MNRKYRKGSALLNRIDSGSADFTRVRWADPCGLCGQEFQRINVPGPDDGEVPMVEGGDLMHAEALSYRDHRGVSGTEQEIGVGLDKIGHTVQVGGGQRHESKDVVPDRAQEPGLSLRATLTFQQVAHLGQDRAGTSKGPGASSNKAMQRA